MDAAARLERRMIGARTKAALAVKKANGQRISGRLPYGFQLAADGKALEPCRDEQKALERMRELRTAGMGGVRIAAALTAEGFNPRGKKWDAGNVQRIADAALMAS
jgi:DNA invertase Pin-like site-specific DNA recombinase